jgi:hypothetical protein
MRRIARAELSTDEQKWQNQFVDPFPEWEMDGDPVEIVF